MSEGDDTNKLRPSDLPIGPIMEDGHEGNMFATGRSLAMKATNEPRLRCTELDGNGNVTLVNGEFKKSELIAKVWNFSFSYVDFFNYYVRGAGLLTFFVLECICSTVCFPVIFARSTPPFFPIFSSVTALF